MFRFSLNTTVVEDPLNWDEFSEIIERDENVRGLIGKYDVELEFHNDGYKLLYDLFTASGYCELVDIIIEYKCNTGNWDTIFTGYIFLSNVKFNLNKCTASCSVEDNSYSARIHNNRKVNAKLDVPFSKNGIAITACPSRNIQFVDPTTNLVIAARLCFDVQDIFEYLILFMTDGEVDFASDWLTAGLPQYFPQVDGSILTVTTRFCVVTGNEIRTFTGATVPDINYEDLFNEINKKFNIGFGIEIQASGRPLIRIENIDYFFNATVNATLIENNDVLQSFDNLKLYSNIEIGSKKIAKYDAIIHSLPPIRFLRFKEEQYAVQGKCNIDRTLDLVSEWVIDHNIIEELVATNITNEDYDDENFIVQYAGVGPYTVTVKNGITATIPPQFYNEALRNDQVAPRWKVQGDIAKYIGNGLDGFEAEMTTTSAVMDVVPVIEYEPVPFDDDSTAPNNDPNGNYNNATYRYVVPADGIYSFQAIIFWTILVGELARTYQVIKIKRYSAANVLLNVIEFTGDVKPSMLTGSFMDIADFTLYCLATDYVVISAIPFPVQGDPGSLTLEYRYDAGSKFKTTAVTNGGGVYAPMDAQSYRISKFNFKRPITVADWTTIKANPAGAISFGISTNDKTGWINRITRNAKTGESEIELISNIDSSK